MAFADADYILLVTACIFLIDWLIELIDHI